MLLFSPRWLFLYPGAALMAGGIAVSVWLIGGPHLIGGVGFDIHTLLVAGFGCVIGYQLIVFAIFTRVYAMRTGFLPPQPLLNRMMRRITLETGLLAGAGLPLARPSAPGIALAGWRPGGFRPPHPPVPLP